jgi:hypothetical protein
MAGLNEEDVKIRERLTSLETKLTFIHTLLQEIRDELKDQPTKEDYDYLNKEVVELKSEVSLIKHKVTSHMIKIGVVSGILGVIGGLLIRILLG